MKRARLPVVATTILAVAVVSFAVLVGVRRLEAASPDLTQADLDVIVAQAVATANATNSGFRVTPSVQKTRQTLNAVSRKPKAAVMRVV